MTKTPEPSPYRHAIQAAAAQHGLDPDLVESVVFQESSGRADAFRHEPGYFERYVKGQAPWAAYDPRRVASSYGLMQIMFPTAVQYGYDGEPEGLFDITTNLTLGCQILRDLLDRFGQDPLKALAAYNGGPSGIGRAAPMHYAHTVVQRYDRIRLARRTLADRAGDPA